MISVISLILRNEVTVAETTSHSSDHFATSPTTVLGSPISTRTASSLKASAEPSRFSLAPEAKHQQTPRERGESMVVVQMLGTTLVYPSSPFPSCHQPLPLSHLDTDRILHLPFRTLRLYAPSLSPADVVANALSAALPLFFPLAASLFRRPSDNRHEVRPPATGIPFTRAASPLTLAELSARPGSPLLDRFAPDPAPGEALAHPLAIQVTRLACGGFALGACVHHSLCDGAGFTQFLSAVAGFARGAERPVVEPVWERAELLGPRSPARVEVPLFRHVLGFDGDVARSGPYDVVEASIEGPLVRECFHVSEACMERLRNRLAEEAGSSFTTFEALSAYIWRARYVRFFFFFFLSSEVSLCR
ncbi:hypothetical protein GW17_00021468 [Ensete ventricosum]|nr:hypothetical protein GW17_00021468 [Ensete ventricosum]